MGHMEEDLDSILSVLTSSGKFPVKMGSILWTDHFALSPQKQGGLLGAGTGGEGDERVKARPQILPKKDRRDRRQNNGSVKAVSPRHCPATSAPRNCCFNCCAWAESQVQCPLHCC